MRFLSSFNRFAGKWMPAIVILSLCTGVYFSDRLGALIVTVPYVFAFMTFSGSLNSGFRQILGIAKHPLPLAGTFLAAHIVLPLLALGLGNLLFPGNPDLITGIVLEFSVPCAVVSVMWSDMNHGNASLTLSILLADTLLAPLVVPLSLRLLVGSSVQVDTWSIMRDLVWMIALPALISMLLNQFTEGRAGKEFSPKLAPFGKMALIYIITINSTRVAPYLKHMTPTLFGVAATILAIAATGYAIGWITAALMRQGREETVSMTFGSGMRNISAGAVLAATYFPAEVMFPVMIGTLFQQLLASLFSKMLKKRYN
ncbi:MAG: bile acid:sodium symporter family protein [Oscillospiraceae bacterium]|jgi:predicted Na+-dependent transporter|nr:bile acid:sodium symporter family protein [Oscillospiraceae bacterium]